MSKKKYKKLKLKYKLPIDYENSLKAIKQYEKENPNIKSIDSKIIDKNGICHLKPSFEIISKNDELIYNVFYNIDCTNIINYKTYLNINQNKLFKNIETKTYTKNILVLCNVNEFIYAIPYHFYISTSDIFDDDTKINIDILYKKNIRKYKINKISINLKYNIIAYQNDPDETKWAYIHNISDLKNEKNLIFQDPFNKNNLGTIIKEKLLHYEYKNDFDIIEKYYEDVDKGCIDIRCLYSNDLKEISDLLIHMTMREGFKP